MCSRGGGGGGRPHREVATQSQSERQSPTTPHDTTRHHATPHRTASSGCWISVGLTVWHTWTEPFAGSQSDEGVQVPQRVALSTAAVVLCLGPRGPAHAMASDDDDDDVVVMECRDTPPRPRPRSRSVGRSKGPSVAGSDAEDEGLALVGAKRRRPERRPPLDDADVRCCVVRRG